MRLGAGTYLGRLGWSRPSAGSLASDWGGLVYSDLFIYYKPFLFQRGLYMDFQINMTDFYYYNSPNQIQISKLFLMDFCVSVFGFSLLITLIL